jgi:DNA-binding ferritin-like protein
MTELMKALSLLYASVWHLHLTTKNWSEHKRLDEMRDDLDTEIDTVCELAVMHGYEPIATQTAPCEVSSDSVFVLCNVVAKICDDLKNDCSLDISNYVGGLSQLMSKWLYLLTMEA